MAEKKVETIMDYVKNQLHDFSISPFNDVDSLILSQLSYVHFNGMVGGIEDKLESVPLKDLLKAECFNVMFNYVLSDDKSKELLFLLAASPRFRDIKLNYYKENTNKDTQEQFSTVTYFLTDETVYVAFRGTDTTLIGWKEDFNMAFMKTVPSQSSAVKHLNSVGNLVSGNIIVGGHSKGGNLAVYSAAKCKPQIQDRITDIYSHDGPGFRRDVICEQGFKIIDDRVKKTVPRFSLIGMLLQQQSEYRVVESDEKFIMQHDPFSWQIDGEDFMYISDVSPKAHAINKSINQWLSDIDDVSREKFIDVLYDVIMSSDAHRVKDLTEERKKSIMAMIDAFKEIDSDTKKFVFQTVRSLTSISVKNLTAIPIKGSLTGKKQ